MDYGTSSVLALSLVKQTIGAGGQARYSSVSEWWKVPGKQAWIDATIQPDKHCIDASKVPDRLGALKECDSWELVIGGRPSGQRTLPTWPLGTKAPASGKVADWPSPYDHYEYLQNTVSASFNLVFGP